MKKVSNEELLAALHLKLEALMNKASESMWNKEESAKNYYDLSAHSFLKNGDGSFSNLPGEVMLPLPKKDWPDKFAELERNYDASMVWPGHSLYCYASDVCCPPSIPYSLLYFGYAMYEDKLIRCPFFVVLQMTEQTLGDTKTMLPEAFVIDPMALLNGVKPDCYIGVPVEKDDISNWFLSRGKSGNPLENYVQRVMEKKDFDRIRDSYMQAYITQYAYAPGWFPQELIDFAKKEGLSIPKQDRTDTNLGNEDEDDRYDDDTDDDDFITIINRQDSSDQISQSKKSKKIFLLRHASYESSGDQEISEYGKRQSLSLAQNIKANLNGDGGNVTIWASTAKRAKGTAEIIRQELGVSKLVEYEELWSDSGHRYDFEWLKKQLDNFKGETLIIVSHLEYVQRFPGEIGFHDNYADYAEGVLIEDGRCVDFD